MIPEERVVVGGMPCAVVGLNGRGQDTGSDIHGDRIDVVGRRGAPIIGLGLEKSVIAEIVVGVGEQDVLKDAAPELRIPKFAAAPCWRSASTISREIRAS